MRKSAVFIPFVLWGFVVLSYVLRHRINTGPIDIYYAALFALPILLLIFRRISFTDLGFSIGKPLTGLFFVFLLPIIFFARFYFIGNFPSITEIYVPIGLVIGSVAEEFFFRGYLQEQLRKFFGTKISIAIASFLFMLVHVVKGYSFFPSAIIFLVGSYFGFARSKEGGGSVLYAMGAHVLYNMVVNAMQGIS